MQRPTPVPAAQAKIVEQYDYTDEDGALLYQVLRYEPKTFKQRRADGAWNMDGVRRVPYRLPEVLKASSAGEIIFVVEGEKAADALVELGLTSTCSPGGAGKWKPEYAKHFAGAGDVIILPDNDDAGEKHAADILQAMPFAKIIRLPGLPEKGDVADWIAAGGTADQLGTLIASSKPMKSALMNSASPFVLTRLSDVVVEPVEWFWDLRLARGKITILGGDPDIGKSQIAIDAAARLSRAVHWPHGAKAPLGSTICLCSEDGVADTVRPRAEAAGADLSKVHVLESRLVRNNRVTRFNLQDDLDILAAAIDQVGDAKLVNIDALTSYVGKVDNNSQSDIRQVLDPLSQFADEKGVAILGIMHPPKGAQTSAIRSFAGSFAYVQSARLAFFVQKEQDSDRNLLLSVKNNLGPKAINKGYRIATKQISFGIVAPYVQWDDAPVDVTADQAIAQAAAARRGGSSLADAKEFLRDLLADGPVDAKSVLAGAKENGISERTLDRAKGDLKIKSEKDPGSLDGNWKWRLP